MSLEQNFKELKAGISSALVHTTRTAGQISNEDLAFQRSINPEVDRLLQEQNRRLLALVRDLTRSATAGTDSVPPPLTNVESVDDGWRGIVDVVDTLLEKADACLDEFTGVIKKLSPSQQNERAATDAKRPLAKHEYRNQNILKPQRLFRRVPRNNESTPFKPLLISKPNALVPLEESLVTAPQPDGSTQYGLLLNATDSMNVHSSDARYIHPYETEIIESTYPKSTYIQSDPTPYLPFESTSATWVDTPEAVRDMLQDLKKATEIAVDVEHHDLHTYVGLVSLLQISTREKDWIVDTLVPWREDLQVLNEVFTDPRIVKVLHGSNSDIVWLQRDLGLYIVGLFDTYHASRLLGYTRHSLAYLLQRHVDFEADKRYQMADWRMRPLPKQMYDYARSDTHFLLYIFDNIRNELLAKSNAASSDGSLIDVVHDKSKGEALQRYERYFYDMNTGSGVWGWRNMLGRSADRLDAQQFAVLRAVHEWRDRIAREEDESLQQILTNRALMLISREMPTALPQLLSFCQPSHMATRKRAQELLELVKRAKAEGANGPEIQDFIIPRGHPNMDHINSIALAAATPRAKSTPVLAGQTLRPEPTSGIIPASLNVSQFWGTTIKGNAQSANGGGTSEPRLALPLPPLTAQVFETRNTDESLRPVKAPTDPGNRAEHQYTKKRKPQEEDVFVVKQGGSKKRRKTDTQDGPEPVQTDRKVADENGIADGDAGQGDTRLVEVEGEGVGLSKSQQRLWRKRKLQEARQDADGNGEAFDYENAPSALHGRRENAGGSGVTRRFDPYSKSLDAPKGMRKVQREGPGRSMTYKS